MGSSRTRSTAPSVGVSCAISSPSDEMHGRFPHAQRRRRQHRPPDREPGAAGGVGGFVVADHADVLGHYDRQDALIGGKPYNAELFHSGAGFGATSSSGSTG